MIKAVLFDAGGTLLRVRGSVAEVYARIAAKHGVAIEAAELEPRFRAAFTAAAALCFPYAAGADVARLEQDWWRQVVQQVFDGRRFADFERFFAELFDYFAAPASWELFADTLPALRALRERGLRLAIVSNFDARLFGICDGLRLTGYFETVIVSGRAGYAKPDARIFAAALSRLGIQSNQAVHIGDDENDDVQGAINAGLKALRIDRNADQQRNGVITDLRQLESVLDSVLPPGSC